MKERSVIAYPSKGTILDMCPTILCCSSTLNVYLMHFQRVEPDFGLCEDAASLAIFIYNSPIKRQVPRFVIAKTKHSHHALQSTFRTSNLYLVKLQYYSFFSA